MSFHVISLFFVLFQAFIFEPATGLYIYPPNEHGWLPVIQVQRPFMAKASPEGYGEIREFEYMAYHGMQKSTEMASSTLPWRHAMLS